MFPLRKVALNQSSPIFTGRREIISGPNNTSVNVTTSINLHLNPLDQYTRAQLDYLFSDKGPVAKLDNYFITASAKLRTMRTPLGCKNKTRVGNEQSDVMQTVNVGKDDKQGTMEKMATHAKAEECDQRHESLKQSIVETQLHERLDDTFLTRIP